jgi:hypothetical protein
MQNRMTDHKSTKQASFIHTRLNAIFLAPYRYFFHNTPCAAGKMAQTVNSRAFQSISQVNSEERHD